MKINQAVFKNMEKPETVKEVASACPSCGSENTWIFYQQDQVPVHSVLLLRSRQEAVTYPTGDIRLAICRECGFITNAAYTPALVEYSEQCEETQDFSPTFNAFHRRLAEALINRYHLHNKTILEIGCGKGEFLALLCEMGDNQGIGFDPAYVEGRLHSPAQNRLNFVQDYYSEKYSGFQADFYCCKMTLEHIHKPAAFMHIVRRSLDNCQDATVFFQVPDVARILRETAFWDIFYEHCSYFSLGSLGRLFRSCGFEVIDLWKDYDDQYLMIEARSGASAAGNATLPLPQEEAPPTLYLEAAEFARNLRQKLEWWRRKLSGLKQEKRRVAIWGSGSKAVGFLTTLQIRDEIPFIVDINPFKQGTYMAGTGQEIVVPGFLRGYRPDFVIIMNPIYRQEIQGDLEMMGLTPEIACV